MLNFHDTRLFLDVSFFPLQLILFFDLFFFLSVFVLHWFRIRLLIFYLLGNPLD